MLDPHDRFRYAEAIKMCVSTECVPSQNRPGNFGGGCSIRARTAYISPEMPPRPSFSRCHYNNSCPGTDVWNAKHLGRWSLPSPLPGSAAVTFGAFHGLFIPTLLDMDTVPSSSVAATTRNSRTALPQLVGRCCRSGMGNHRDSWRRFLWGPLRVPGLLTPTFRWLSDAIRDVT